MITYLMYLVSAVLVVGFIMETVAGKIQQGLHSRHAAGYRLIHKW